MKHLQEFINESMQDWWRESDFDDKEVNYYLLKWTDEYDSLAGPQKLDYRYWFIIWDKEELSEKELNKLISDHASSFEKKKTNKANDDFREVKHATLKEILKDAYKDSKNHCWSAIVDSKENVTVYWIDA